MEQRNISNNLPTGRELIVQSEDYGTKRYPCRSIEDAERCFTYHRDHADSLTQRDGVAREVLLVFRDHRTRAHPVEESSCENEEGWRKGTFQPSHASRSVSHVC